MNTFSLLHSTRVLLPEGLREAWVLIRNGRIAAIHDHHPGGLQATDLGDLVLMPGLIDPHVHINEPGRTEWEGFDTATRAAAAGGITTLVDMPLNSSPVTTTAEALQAKLAAAQGKVHVNVGFHGGIVPGNTAHLLPLAQGGVLGIKAFLAHSGIDDFPNVTEDDLHAGMPLIAQSGLPLLVHAELPAPHAEEGLMAEHPRSHDAWLRSRPKEWEDRAIAQMIALCRQHGTRVHIVHLSSAQSIPQLRAAQAEGLPITVETCPHYLLFAAEDIADGATAFKCAPPIRERANREKLWEGLRSGVITMVVTDHSPATPDLKGLDHGRFPDSWGGIASLQYSLPATWTAAKARGFSLSDVSAWMSGNPAAFMGLQGRKGRIAVDYDADLVAWDPDAPTDTSVEHIQHRHPLSPYAGLNLLGRVAHTWVGGKIVFDQGKFTNLASGNILLRIAAHENR